jgi:NAD(P)-dependent dehydrogenase (short-subunit alcohol dehydrogenase family)
VSATLQSPQPAAARGRLSGRAAVVTGAARGIGRATAELFAHEGARLVVTDVDGNALEPVYGRLVSETDVEPVVGDVAEAAAAERMIQAAVERYGAIDVLVANAGIIPLSNILDASPEAFDDVMAVDGRGMFLTCKYAIEAMLASGRGGSIVCVSSISGVAGQKGQATYGPAKFVASGLAKHLAVEWADRGIRVNAVAPGTIATDRVRRLAHEPGGREYLEAITLQHPLGRLGEPVEVARSILFLASDEASFITGVVLPVDGGYLAQ